MHDVSRRSALESGDITVLTPTTPPQTKEPQRVRIPFKARFREPMLSGTKIYTSRTKVMGNAGDTFKAFGATFLIIDLSTIGLDQVADLWKPEGCKSREDFIQVWNEIHSVRGYRPTDSVYLHEFRKL